MVIQHLGVGEEEGEVAIAIYLGETLKDSSRFLLCLLLIAAELMRQGSKHFY